LRRKLIEFFEEKKTLEIEDINKDEIELKAKQVNRNNEKLPIPFESWFEVDVALEIKRKGFVVRPQFKYAGKRIDLVIIGGQLQLAIECDGDKWHGPENYEADMLRQRQLERSGWVFFRVRGSAFYSNRESALQGLWQLLEERGILPDYVIQPTQL
jgi:very-short-patch-repair endonuclease